MLSDEERAAFKAVVIGMSDEDFEKDPLAAMENLFAAGIAYAQTWRSMESAPFDTPIAIVSMGRVEEGMYTDSCDVREEILGWLPLPPTQEVK